MNYEQVMKFARETNKKRDMSEQKNGFTPESELAPHIQLRTAMLAIEAGIKKDDWSCIAEAQAILENIANMIDKAIKARGAQ